MLFPPRLKRLRNKGRQSTTHQTAMQVCDRVVFMDAGAKISEGTPRQVRDDPRVIEAYID